MAALLPEEIRERLRGLVDRWADYDGSERSGSQPFLIDLFACYGVKDLQAMGIVLEKNEGGKFIDLLWPEKCLIEMKRPSEAGKLAAHRKQALDYWDMSSSVDEKIAAPRYVVLCAFTQFEIWEPGRFRQAPVAEFALADLPDKWESLAFLADLKPAFRKDEVAVTVKAVDRLAELHHALELRDDLDPSEIDEFILQSVWCLFAEDFGLLPKAAFTDAAERCLGDESVSTANELGAIFETLNKPPEEKRFGHLKDIRYVNGDMFKHAARIDLTDAEIEMLLNAAREDWTRIKPQIIGSLLEGTMKGSKQAVGVHYTHEDDIMKVVGPVIVEPWTERIAEIETWDDAIAEHFALTTFHILDPACGSGNFLYVAYREMRKLQEQLRTKAMKIAKSEGRQNPEKEMEAGGKFHDPFPLTNMLGIETMDLPSKIARLTLWLGHALTVRELGLREPVIPLPSLPGIQRADALRIDWPAAEAIVGNPPFLGSQNLRGELGDDYVEWLKERFGVGAKDLCVYWYRIANDRLQPGCRAGLVGTNSVSQNKARGASLDYIAANGGVIINAVSKHKWPGDAVVNVSIVNWVKEPAEPVARFVLDGEEVAAITTSLRSQGGADGDAAKLAANKGRAFQGPIPVGDGFVLAEEEARRVLGSAEADYSEVVRPYLIGKDIAESADQGPTRWIIDFAQMALENAQRYPEALTLVRERVKPVRDGNKDKRFRTEWWRFGRPRGEMREAVAGLDRFIAGTATGKRFLFAWVDKAVCPSNATNVFAFSDDYGMGILTARPHIQWALRQSSTMRTDLRYTPTTAFETYPWPPAPTAKQRDAVAGVAKRLIELRSKLCVEHGLGLTKLYNDVDDGAHADLKKLHRELDKAVAAAYGWPASISGDTADIIKRLSALSADIAAGRVEYDPFKGWAD